MVKVALAESDLPSLFQQAFKVILAKEDSVFQALFIQHIALDHKLPQHLSHPLAELGGQHGTHQVSHRDEGIEIIKFRVVVFTISDSCSEFPNN